MRMDKEQIKSYVREVIEEQEGDRVGDKDRDRKIRKTLSSVVKANFANLKSKLNRQRMSKGRVQKKVFPLSSYHNNARMGSLVKDFR